MLLTRFLAERESDVLSEFMHQAAQYRSVSVDQITDLVLTMQEKVEQLAGVLSLELPSDLDFKDVLEQSHQQLVAAATDAAVELVRDRQQLDARRCEILAEGPEAAELAGAVSDWCTDDRTTGSAAFAEPATVGFAASEAPRPRATTAAGITPIHSARSAGASIADCAARSAPASSGQVEIAIAEDDPALIGRLNVAVAACRQARCPVSLLLVEIDHFADAHFTYGPDAPQQLWRMVQSACQLIDHANTTCIPVREARFAVILPNCDRQHAARLGKQLVRGIRDRKVTSTGGDGPTLTISAGAASVTQLPKNFPPQELIESADRCLYGAQACGGDGLKSLEIY